MLNGYERHCISCPEMGHVRIFVKVWARELYVNVSADARGLVLLEFVEGAANSYRIA